VVNTYYDLLEVPRGAAGDEIKRAFRREIAKYHPDKVQHLGREFQDMAAAKAAELTQAYKTLTDASQRAAYDAQLGDAVVAPASAWPRVAVPTPEAADPPALPTQAFAQERAGAVDLVRRAAVMRLRQALQAEFSGFEAPLVPGFEVGCVPPTSFWKRKHAPRVLGRYVPVVDGAAVSEAWGLASRMKRDEQRDLCVFVMGPVVAPPNELAAAISRERRKPMPAGGVLVLIPVNTLNWQAHVPMDAPPVVKSLLARLQSS
jgi:hypothetical protein